MLPISQRVKILDNLSDFVASFCQTHWLMCFFHRFDKTREEFEKEVMAGSNVPLSVESRLTSGDDFPESNPSIIVPLRCLRLP